MAAETGRMISPTRTGRWSSKLSGKLIWEPNRELVRQYIRKLSHESEKVSSNHDPHLKWMEDELSRGVLA
jgi:hypothetical protein